MGQAKLRGTQAQRAAEAITRTRRQFPDKVSCNHCHAELTDIDAMDVRGIEGMRLAGVAHCAACDHNTWVLSGDPEGLERFQQFLDDRYGSEVVATGQVRHPEGR